MSNPLFPVDDANNSAQLPAYGTVVGHINVTESRVHTDRNYENAGWYQTSESEVGTFEVTLEANREGVPHLVARIPATVVGSDFTSTFCGNRVGSKIDSNVGERVEQVIRRPLSDLFTEFDVSADSEHFDALVRWSFAYWNARSRVLVSHCSGVAENLEVRTGFDGSTDGKFLSWRAGDFASYGRWLTECGEVLRGICHPTPTDRWENLGQIVDAWGNKFAGRYRQWEKNREYRARQAKYNAAMDA